MERTCMKSRETNRISLAAEWLACRPGLWIRAFAGVTTALFLATTASAQTLWYLRYPLPTASGLLGVTYGNGQFVAVGYLGTVLTSPDAVTWTSQLLEHDSILEDVAFGNGRFVAVGGHYDW